MLSFLRTFMDGISKALNTSFQKDISKNEKEIISLDVELESLKTKKELYETKRLTLEDKEYMALELKELISSTQEVRKILEENLKRPPHRASDVEAYSLIISQLTVLVRELRMLNTDSVGVELTQRKMDMKTESVQIGTQNNNVFLFDSKSLDAMINDAKENSQIKNIVADFDITDVR
jgi:hypothetical protein